MSEWVEKPLGDLAKIQVSNVDKKTIEGEQPVRLCNYMDVYSNDYLGNHIDYMDATASAQEISRFSLTSGDVIITKDSESPDDIGIPATLIEDVAGIVCGYHLALLRPDPSKVDPIFLLKQLASAGAASYFGKRAAGSTRYALSTSTISNTPIPLAPLEEQRKISFVLRLLDTQIEATEALIAKQERLRAGLMQDLFTRGVDENGELRPPRYEAPHLYDETELGWLPKDWDVGELQSYASVNRGKFAARPRNDPKFYGGEFPFIQTGDVSGNSGRNISNHRQTLNRMGLLTSRLFPEGAIMISIAANIGDAATLSYAMCAPDSVVGVVANDEADVAYLQLAILQKKRWLESRAPQTAQRNINLEDLRPLLLPIPQPSEREKIVLSHATLQDRIVQMEGELDKLRLKKAGLMQDLLTGAVSVEPLLEKEPA